MQTALAAAEAAKANLLRDTQLALGNQGDLKQALNGARARVAKLEAQLTAVRGEASATSVAAREASRRAGAAEEAVRDSESRRSASDAAARAAEHQRGVALTAAQNAIGREGDLKQQLNKARQAVSGGSGGSGGWGTDWRLVHLDTSTRVGRGVWVRRLQRDWTPSN